MSSLGQGTEEVCRDQRQFAFQDYYVQVKYLICPYSILTVVFRDGVGDGQIPYVVDHEITAIQNCFRNAGLADDQLQFTYIIVSKRINTRFFRCV